MLEALTFDVAARAVASALLHSIWQGALAAAAAGFALRLLRDAAPQARYAVGCLALAALLGAWMVTAARTAVLAAPALAGATGAPAAPLLGPGPLDFSSAVRDIPAIDLRGAAPQPSWGSRFERWSAAAVPVWLIGVVLLSLRLTFGWLSIERLRRTHVTPLASELSARVAALAMRVRVSRPVRVAQSAAIRVPAVVGWVRPVILLPASAITGLTPAQLDAIVAHELAHVRRHDYAMNLLQSVAETLLFYHPACWWISRRIRAEREHCCDDIAVALCGDRIAYAAALADLEALRQRPALAVAATDGPLLQRVRRLLGPATPAGPPWVAAAAPLCAIALLLTTVTLVPALAQSAPEQRQAPGMGRTIPADRGIVQGQVVEAGSGQPIEGARVELRGKPGAVFVTTDRAGRYETPPLTPGAYTVSVTAPGHALAFYASRTMALSAEFVSLQKPFTVTATEHHTRTSVDVRAGALVSNINLTMQATGQLSGRILDDRGRALARAQVQLVATRASAAGTFPRLASAQSEADGTYRVAAPPGDYVVRASIDARARPSRDGATVYVATFYPGVRTHDAAQVIRLVAGAEQFDIDFALLSTGTVRVSGTVIDPSGNGLEDITVSLRGAQHTSAETPVRLDLNARGEFDTSDVVPGRYFVDVQDPHRPSRWSTLRQPLEITENVAGLEIRAVEPASITARIVRDPRSGGQPDLRRLQIGLVSRADESAMSMRRLEAREDGSFHGEVPAGQWTLLAMGGPDWSARSVLLDGVEVFGRPIALAPGAHEIDVVLSDRVTSVSGLVVDRRGTPLPGFDVVLFPHDETAWYFASPLIHQTRSRQNGVFELTSLPPGDYLAVATEGVPLLMIGDPEPTLRRLQSIATRFKVGDGERKTISIRASPTPEGLVRFTP